LTESQSNSDASAKHGLAAVQNAQDHRATRRECVSVNHHKPGDKAAGIARLRSKRRNACVFDDDGSAGEQPLNHAGERTTSPTSLF